MHVLVRRIFALHFPANGRGRRRADEEQTARVGPVKVFHLLVADGRGLAKVAFCDAVAEERRAVDGLSDGNAGVDVVEGADDPVHGLQWGE